jgi:hypothetical protein
MAVRRHLIGNMANNSNSLPEKLLSRLHIPLLTQPRINQIGIPPDTLEEVMTDRDGIARTFSVPPGAVREAQLRIMREQAQQLLPRAFADLLPGFLLCHTEFNLVFWGMGAGSLRA